MAEPRPWDRSAAALAARVRAGEVAPTVVAAATLERIAATDGAVNAFVTVTDETAMAAAREVEAAVDDEAGADPDRVAGPLAGVPVALKDLEAPKAGVRHTFGSTLFADNVADRTAAVVERLEAAGAVVVGKTNTPAFGHAATTNSAVAGPTASPVAPSLNAGGSSGGSAAAVAAGQALVATGSDAGGSIRIPAAACGVVGLKPSFGLVPDDGRPNAFGRRVHHATLGPLARSVGDVALAMDVMAGPHPADPATVPVDVDFRGAADRQVDGLRVAYSPDLDVFPVADAVRAVVADAVGAFEAAGATVEEVRLDHGLSMADLSAAVDATFGVTVFENAELLRQATGVDLRDHRDQVPDSLLTMIDRGATLDAAAVARTGPTRTAVFDAVRAVLAEYDVLVTPTLAVRGFEGPDAVGPGDWDVTLTWPFNWTGHPAASVPAGRTDGGRPVGMQVVGPRYGDDVVVAASAAVERERPWHDHYPD